MPRYVAAIDQGTTGSRCILFGHDGTIVSQDHLEHTQIYPEPGWVEHDALEVWSRVQAVVRGAMDRAQAAPGDLAAIGITDQRETALVWDRRTGRPIYNAIVWQDTRTRDQVQRLIDDGFEETLRERTGLVAATYFSAPKIRWILDHVDGARQRAEAGDLLFGNMDTWTIWCLTGGPSGGVHVTDHTNASRTLLMNLRTLDWDGELLRWFGIPRQLLPAIRASSDPGLYGRSTAAGPFAGEVAIAGDLGDQQAAAFGQTCYDVGEAKNTYGTGNFLLLNTGAEPIRSRSGLLTTVAYSFEKDRCTYALEGSIAVTGSAVQWLRDNLNMISDAADTERLAMSVDDTGGCFFVPAFSGLFAPYWDMYARGAIVGLTRFVDRRHLARATLESVAYQSRDVVEAMEADSGVRMTKLKVDGGMTKNDFLMQLQSDILGRPVIRPTVSETTALGAAYAAGLAVGFWSSLDELRQNWAVDQTWEPTWTEEARAAGYVQWKKAIERTRDWVDR
ncbi:MAG: glycerol kinase GlpK [Candidatus Dormiibacterota bacterium]